VSSAAPTPHVSFAALRHPGYRVYFVLAALAMMADNIEHVISYWVIYEHFQSPALGGFAVISHWLPFLLFSVPSGALNDRYDSRRLIQIGMGLFAVVSLCWGLLFVWGDMHIWQACVLLILHGCAGVLWGPATQVLLHDIVGREHLQSAVRLNSTSRQLGMVAGPGVGGGLLMLLGPKLGIFVNAVLYLPLILWLVAAPYGPRFRSSAQAVVPRAIRSLRDVWDTLQEIGRYKIIASMTALAGCASLFVGNAYQAQMPGFATDLGHGHVDFTYSLLLGADALGALTAGFVLESRGLRQAKPKTAVRLAMIWSLALLGFALTAHYPVALLLLFVAGFVELSFNAMSQTLVQLEAPAALRGRAIGVYTMFSGGMRTFSGITVGLVGAQLGIHWSLAGSAALLFIVIGLLMRRVGRAESA